jgi:hypothetical protein
MRARHHASVGVANLAARAVRNPHTVRAPRTLNPSRARFRLLRTRYAIGQPVVRGDASCRSCRTLTLVIRASAQATRLSVSVTRTAVPTRGASTFDESHERPVLLLDARVKHVSNGVERCETAGSLSRQTVRSAGLAGEARAQSTKSLPRALVASDLADPRPGELDTPSLAGDRPPGSPKTPTRRWRNWQTH